jgi:hypothetical protein
VTFVFRDRSVHVGSGGTTHLIDALSQAGGPSHDLCWRIATEGEIELSADEMQLMRNAWDLIGPETEGHAFDLVGPETEDLAELKAALDRALN